jgi:hypothetical protein
VVNFVSTLTVEVGFVSKIYIRRGKRMKNNIPKNAVSKDYNGVIDSFTKQLIEAEKDNIINANHELKKV